MRLADLGRRQRRQFDHPVCRREQLPTATDLPREHRPGRQHHRYTRRAERAQQQPQSGSRRIRHPVGVIDDQGERDLASRVRQHLAQGGEQRHLPATADGPRPGWGLGLGLRLRR